MTDGSRTGPADAERVLRESGAGELAMGQADG
jgi:hypothetical protein